MSLTKAPKGYRYPVTVISYVVWLYHRFNHSYRDVKEQLQFRGIDVSHETVRNWCYRFSTHFEQIIKKRNYKVKDNSPYALKR